ncbi:MAG TPA: metalloregulator ArsR/SmtB family transcription factor [Victivallales bacterium]|nr:metalloregulator ArsR/SmtB family transcription factor [Victivallales bacterium]
MHDFMNIAKALSDPNRVRILLALKDKELCVCQLIEFLGLAPSTVSKHMSIMKNARLVESRKEGLWKHYKLPSKASREIRKALEWVCSSLSESEEAKKDAARMKKILEIDIADICERQNSKSYSKK